MKIKKTTLNSKNRFSYVLIIFLFLLGISTLIVAQEVSQNKFVFNADAARANNFGKALELNTNPKSPSYLDIKESQNLNAKKDFTVELWVKLRQTKNDTSILSKRNGSENGYDIFLHSEPIENNLYSVNYSFNVADANMPYHAARRIELQDICTAEELTSWHHIAGVIQSDGKMDIFVDGQRSTSNFNYIQNIWSNTMPVSIGVFKSAGQFVDGFIYGTIDEVRISSVSRYTQNFSPPLKHFDNDQYTMSLLHLDGNTLDSSSNAKLGVITGDVKYVKSTVSMLPKSKPTSILYPNKKQ